jgi:hypothetical protein
MTTPRQPLLARSSTAQTSDRHERSPGNRPITLVCRRVSPKVRSIRLVWRAKLRERVAVEHTLAQIGHWQGHRARYLGQRKNLFDLRRCAVVHNLHIIARGPWASQPAV